MGYMGCTADGYSDYLIWLAGEVDNEPEYDENGQPIIEEEDYANPNYETVCGRKALPQL